MVQHLYLITPREYINQIVLLIERSKLMCPTFMFPTFKFKLSKKKKT